MLLGVFFELGISIFMGYATGQLMRLALPPREKGQGAGVESNLISSHFRICSEVLTILIFVCLFDRF